MTGVSDASLAERRRGVEGLTLAWAVKRALFGLLILSVLITAAAWLLYASIEPERADSAQAVVASQRDGGPAIPATR